MLNDERHYICKKALDLKSSSLSDWDKGFIHAITMTSAGVPDSFYFRLKILCEAQDAQRSPV